MRELFQPAWFGFLMEKCNVIPISRERVDTKAFKIALDRLKAGRIVGIFPEGGLRAGKTSVLEGAELTEGFSLLAMRSDCAVRPVVLVGSDQLYVAKNWFRRPRVVVAVGYPIPAPLDREDRKEWAEKLAEAMRALYVDVKKRYTLEAVVLPKTPQERWRDGR